MWNLSKEVKERFTKSNLLPIHETDEEWEYVINEAEVEGEDLAAKLREELENLKGQLLNNLPKKFIPYVEDGTLNQPILPKKIREDYLRWVKKGLERFKRY
ncbi:hypothetical protein BACCIP111883_02316 [Sutcliffiella rhizosphaerae]|uniref:Uncharacterized protein n=1 Tax=Sutcliffiella rhizosphaerae TaxID=2880967 RepID=A0ABM8YNH5_9BACI|nr:hypothetical protein BACCIP111883_02316 [Sutcliffiella rhizosphaerae]